MRLRTDSGHVAGWKRAHALRGCDCTPAMRANRSGAIGPGHVAHLASYDDVEPAQLGDVWRIKTTSGEVAGYALTCPDEACISGVHFWSHTRDCRSRQGAPDHASCWQWTGSPEAGDLSASPSLWSVAEYGGCGWHGFLTNGEMRSV